ncbi:MAG: hypothetical protein KA165_17900, partial [Saprospiraceae bacterium]|nr:hypothetical protein [Saprospiraceae bacterium]
KHSVEYSYYVFYVPMCLNYATDVVEHIDLTASQSFRAKIRDDPCLPFYLSSFRQKTKVGITLDNTNFVDALKSV